jgi:hypothetical protein
MEDKAPGPDGLRVRFLKMLVSKAGERSDHVRIIASRLADGFNTASRQTLDPTAKTSVMILLNIYFFYS